MRETIFLWLSQCSEARLVAAWNMEVALREEFDAFVSKILLPEGGVASHIISLELVVEPPRFPNRLHQLPTRGSENQSRAPR